MAKQISAKKIELILLDSIQEQIRQRQDLLQKTNFNKASRISYYADRFAASLPLKGISLQTLEIFPLSGRQEDYADTELVNYINDKIYAKGSCSDSDIYNKWHKFLERQTWIIKINHLKYSDISLEKSEFEIEIIIDSSGMSENVQGN